ncbi:type IV toxin-antitoxin system AbiEi family antitoxin domain-containing protein [Velocimicrobium porci]|mgnify:CR=1 FL=1|uniref:AbiEi antitoxin N-terminal domain-containing protein n=1 Tax=Velocimicrobium porci TaxID=2606634 RepID=A0A6L5Y0N7_9FIRM|nr:type IV toxin-antitoxin system AbiEi family antitoxin domain-containing protein [Velocimicrobium porci]MSS63978.1 hypothetical protein [Velocimicrobium porci]
MNYEQALEKFIAESDGTILTKDVEDLGIPRQYLNQFQKEGKLEHVSHGIYITARTKLDQLYYIQLRSKQIIFSGKTALVLHHLVDTIPDKIYVTVPQTYATNRLRESGLGVMTVKPELHELGKIEYLTKYNHLIQIYDKERTICDIVKARNKLEKDYVYSVLKAYTKEKEKDYHKLMNYAKKLRIRSVLSQYLEILMA